MSDWRTRSAATEPATNNASGGWRSRAVAISDGHDSEPETKIGQAGFSQTPAQDAENKAALRGLQQTASFGTADWLTPIAENTMQGWHQIAADVGVPGVSKESAAEMGNVYGGPYLERVQKEKNITNRALTDYPVPFLAASLGGGLLGGLGAAATKAPVLVNSALGLIQGAGASKTTSASDVAASAGIGGILGVFSGLLQKATQAGLNPKALASTANKVGSKALGFLQSPAKKAGGTEKVQEAVGVLLKHGKVIKPWKSAKAMGETLDVIQEESGTLIGNTLKQMDDAGVKTIDPTAIFTAVSDSEVPGLGKTLSQVAQDSPEIAKELQTFSDRLGRIGGGNANAAATFKEMQYQKQLLKKSINWTESDAAGNLGNQAKKIMYSQVTDALDGELEKAAQQINDPDLFKQFMTAKELYGAASTAQKGIGNKLAREAANKAFSLTDYSIMGGGLAGTMMNPKAVIPGVAALLTKKTAEKYAPQAISWGLHQVSRAVGAPNYWSKIVRYAPEALVGAGRGGIVQAVSQGRPE